MDGLRALNRSACAGRLGCGHQLDRWAVPFLTVPLGMAGIPISSLPILLLGGRLVWRLWISAEQPTDAIRGSPHRPRVTEPLATG